MFESADDAEDSRTLAGTVFASYASLRAVSPAHARGLAVPAKKANWEKERDRFAKAARRRVAPSSGDFNPSGVFVDGGVETSAASVATVGVAHPQGARYDARDDDARDARFAGFDDAARAPASTFGETSARVTAVAAYRLNDGKRYFAVADASGKVVVFADRGATVHSVYRVRDDGEAASNPSATPNHVVAFKPSRRAISWWGCPSCSSVKPLNIFRWRVYLLSAARSMPARGGGGTRSLSSFAGTNSSKYVCFASSTASASSSMPGSSGSATWEGARRLLSLSSPSDSI